ncbi:MAG TPA: class I SAM-dependent methyltransferase [Solirubrobacteraceae bacterium]|nr:class I SAM-dependent methyltransferase [Solirubrobacteraceae bacterium]
MGETVVPERFVPAAMRGQLVEAEHLVRYWWAARVAAGRRVLDAGCGTAYGTAMLAAAGARHVTGVDRAAAVLDAARPAMPENVDLVPGDLRELPFADRTFELIACFEVIEHLSDPDAALKELERVVTRDGVLLVSSPNRDVYEPGNPHHLHEYTPAELQVALERFFPHVELRRQANLIASAVMPDDVAAKEELDDVQDVRLAKCVALPPARETYTLALASHAALPPDRSTTAVATGLTEIRKWLELYDEQHAGLLDRDARIRRLEEADATVRAARAALVEGEQDHARAIRLREDLAAAEERCAELRAELERAAATMAQMKRSPSWRLTAPLRAAKRVLRRG